jgi:hypothetical protein
MEQLNVECSIAGCFNVRCLPPLRNRLVLEAIEKDCLSDSPKSDEELAPIVPPGLDSVEHDVELIHEISATSHLRRPGAGARVVRVQARVQHVSHRADASPSVKQVIPSVE